MPGPARQGSAADASRRSPAWFFVSQRVQRDLGFELICEIPVLGHSRIASKVQDTT